MAVCAYLWPTVASPCLFTQFTTICIHTYTRWDLFLLNWQVQQKRVHPGFFRISNIRLSLKSKVYRHVCFLTLGANADNRL